MDAKITLKEWKARSEGEEESEREGGKGKERRGKTVGNKAREKTQLWNE